MVVLPLRGRAQICKLRGSFLAILVSFLRFRDVWCEQIPPDFAGSNVSCRTGKTLATEVLETASVCLSDRQNFDRKTPIPIGKAGNSLVSATVAASIGYLRLSTS